MENNLDNQPTPQQVVDHMLVHDKFSEWMGIKVLEIR
jgi:hypothetical protein